MRTTGLLLCGWLLNTACLAAIDPTLLKPLACLLKPLASEDSETKIAAIAALAQAAPDEALPVLKALADDSLALAGERVVIVDGARVLDAASHTEIKPTPAATETIGINNRVRRELSGALAALRLFSNERAMRWQAAQELTLSADAKMLPLLDRALAIETDPEIRTRLQFPRSGPACNWRMRKPASVRPRLRCDLPLSVSSAKAATPTSGKCCCR